MQQIRITLKSFDPQCLSVAIKHIIKLARLFEIQVKSRSCSFLLSKKETFLQNNKEIAIKKIDLPKKIKKITVLRSPHIDKKSREQFEIRRNKTVFLFNIKNKSSAILFFECLKNSQLYGVELSIDIRSTCFYSIF